MTVGISPKAKLAALFPAVATLLTVVVLWLVTGELDQAELKVALTGLIAAATAFAGAFVGEPGDVVSVVGPASDDLLSDDAKARLARQ